MGDPRQTRAWRKLRDRVVREEPICRLNILDICTITSTTADHIQPVSTHPQLAMDRTNLRGSCQPCNNARRDLPDAVFMRQTSSHDETAAPALAIFDE